MYKLRTSNNGDLEICNQLFTEVFDLNDLIKENGAIKTYNSLNIKNAFIPVIVDRTLYENKNNFSKLYDAFEKDVDKKRISQIYLFNIFDIISYNHTNVDLVKPFFDFISKYIDKDTIVENFKGYLDNKPSKTGMKSGMGNGLLHIVASSLYDEKEKAFEVYKEIFNFCDFRYKEDFNIGKFLDIEPFGDLNRKIINEIYEKQENLIFTINGVQQIFDLKDKSEDDIKQLKKLMENIINEKNVELLLYKVEKINELYDLSLEVSDEKIYALGGGISEKVTIKDDFKYSDIEKIINEFNNNKNIDEFEKLLNR